MANAVVSFTEDKTATGIHWRKTFTADSRPVLVLVMGYGGSLRIWPTNFVERLAQKYVVITYDNRGTGLSIVPEDPTAYTIEGMSKDLDEVMVAAGSHSFHLLGYSMGSCIALRYAHDHAAKVRTLFLLCGTAGGSLYAKPAAEVSAALAKPAGETLWEMYMSTWQLMYSPAMMEKCQPALTAIFEYSKDSATTPIALAGHSHAFKGFDGSGYLSEFTMPTTLLAGEDDRLMPVANSFSMASKIRGAKLVLLPNCEHCPHIQNEDTVISEIEMLAK